MTCFEAFTRPVIRQHLQLIGSAPAPLSVCLAGCPQVIRPLDVYPAGGGVEWEGTGLVPVRLALAIQRQASGKAAPRVRLSEEGAHWWPLHGWLTVCPWQLVIYHCWAAMSGGSVINFTLPFSEISPINHSRLSLCAGFHCGSVWQIFTWSLCPAQASCQTGSSNDRTRPVGDRANSNACTHAFTWLT